MRLELRSGDRTHLVEVIANGDAYAVTLDGEPVALELIAAGQGELVLVLEGRRRRALVAAAKDERHVFLDGRVFTFGLPRPDEPSADQDDLAGPNVTARMPGTVVKLLVEPGQAVAEGHGLLIMESMKMETEIAAPVAGKVLAVHVAAGQTVGMGDLLVDLEPAGPPPAPSS